MNYELAKQLYDAGFPQQGFGRWVGNPDQVIWRAGDRVYVPTLEELIKACGDDFNSLVLRNRDEKCWGATGRFGCDVRGKTPEEATARLWLALTSRRTSQDD